MRHFFYTNRLDIQDKVIHYLATRAHREQHTVDVACEVVETTVCGRTTRAGQPTAEPEQPTPHHHALPVPDRCP